jgi:hypothetical protein
MALLARSWDFCGICCSNQHPLGVCLDDESTFYLRLHVVGGDGFEPPTPAL